MKANNQLRYLMLAFLGMVLMAFAPIASATPVGHLDLTNCAGGGATVTATTINFLPDINGTDGCIDTGTTTNIVYSGGVIGPGVQGAIKDLTPANPLPVADFMTFPFPGPAVVSFELTGIGPGVANTDCAALMVGESCAAFAGSPFILTRIATNQTTVILPLVGTMTDATGSIQWIGQFSTNISNMSPATIQSVINGGGSVSSAYSGDLNAVPEPATAASMMLGGLLLAMAGRAIRKR